MVQASTIKNGILTVLAAIGAVLTNLIGGWDIALKVLIIIMAVDYLTGLIVAGVFKRSGKSETGALDSRAGFKGICKKVSILLLVLIAAQLDQMIGLGAMSRTAVIFFFCGNEGLSVLENMGLMGVPYPEVLKSALEAIKSKSKSADE